MKKNAIINKWSRVKIEYGIKPADVLKWSLVVVGASSCILLLFVFWNRSLAKKVGERTAELETSNRSLEVEISERIQAEAALTEYRRFADNLIESANVMIVGLDVAGNVTLFNPAAEKITGYTLSDLRNKNWFDLLVPRDRYPEVHTEFIRLLDGGLPKFFENAILTKNGNERFVSWSNSELTLDGETIGTLSFGVDITDRRQAEQQLRDYQHRLKALATQLTIAEERERRRIAADLHDQVGQSLAFARMGLASAKKAATGDNLAALLDDISAALLAAVQDTRHLIFKLSPPQMNEIGLSAAIGEWLEEEIENRHGIATELVDTGSKKRLDDDVRAILFRNVRELLVNVVKHAQAGRVTVRVEHEESLLRVIVQDDGAGFDPEAVFGLRNSAGGFGLFSVRERMNDLGGSLDIVSEAGRGCTATLTLPVEI